LIYFVLPIFIFHLLYVHLCYSFLHREKKFKSIVVLNSSAFHSSVSTFNPRWFPCSDSHSYRAVYL